jgi:hypothetical protein
LLPAPSKEERLTAVLTARQQTPTLTYLSHEVTLLTSDGDAWSLPTPIPAPRWLERPWVRRWGARLRRLTLPTVTLNAYTQWLFPPRYTAVADLIPISQQTHTAPLPQLDPATAATLTHTLQQDASSAYDFPLFNRLLSEIPPATAEAWHSQERQILTKILTAAKPTNS